MSVITLYMHTQDDYNTSISNMNTTKVKFKKKHTTVGSEVGSCWKGIPNGLWEE